MFSDRFQLTVSCRVYWSILNSVLKLLPMQLKLRGLSLYTLISVFTMALCCCCSVAKYSLTLLQPHDLQPARLLCPLHFPGKNTGVGCHFLLKGIFLTQKSNPHLLHWQADSLLLSHQRNPPLKVQFTKQDCCLFFITIILYPCYPTPFSHCSTQDQI